eukprot:gene13999-16548_t
MPNHGNKYVVIKLMRKSKLLRINQVENVIREKDILLGFNCPFIITCLGHFQDSCNCYLLLEYMAGGEVFGLLNQLQRFSTQLARFYAAETLLALEYIHKRHYVYRDLKPENILIADNGHVMLADMGFCKPLKRGERTYTTCGTADYMAPEVMLCQGHDQAADFWAFGVLIFEMIAGYPPFEGDSDNERLHYILNGSLVFPEDFNLQAKDLVLKLCTVDVSKRYGMLAAGIADIKNHLFFADIDFRSLSEQQPPHLPKLAALSGLEGKHLKLGTKADTLNPEQNKAFAGF